MEIIKFKELLKDYNAIRINEEYIIFNDYELYSFVKTTAKVCGCGKKTSRVACLEY